LGIEAGLSKCFDLVGVGINGGWAVWLGGIDFSHYSITITKFASKTDNLKEQLQIVVEFAKKAGKHDVVFIFPDSFSNVLSTRKRVGIFQNEPSQPVFSSRSFLLIHDEGRNN
jgi:hypothetical protein